MADKRVSDLPLIDITAVRSNNLLLLVDQNEPQVGDRNKRLDLGTLFQFINNQLSAEGEGIYLVQGPNAIQEGYFNVVRVNRITGNTLDNASIVRIDDGTQLSVRDIISSGPISLSAGGTNQNITVAPSGTGSLIFNTAGVVQIRASANGLRIYNSNNNYYVDVNTESLSGNRRLIIADGTTSLVAGTMVPTARTLGITTTNGLSGGATGLDLSASRAWTLSLTGQASAFHNLATTGLIVRSAADTIITREITVSGDGISVVNGTAVGGNPVISVNSTAANTPSTIVLRDASGNFTAGTVTAALVGNASTATTLQTPRLINGTSFDGSGNITTLSWGTSRTISIGGTAKAVDGSANVTWTTAELAAQTAVTLATAREINGTSFNGSTDITTAIWGTARNITIGSTTRSVNGSTTYSWSLSDIGVNNATLTLNATGIATGSQTWTANQGTNATFTVNVPGTNLSFSSGTTTGPTINSSTGTGAAIPAASGTNSGVVTTDTQTFAGVKTFLSPISGSLGGNASTATALQTARLINGVSFNGTADITITANTTQTLTRGAYLTGNNFNGSAATTWAVDATTTNTASKVVARDASGNFAAGTITAALSGNASTATLASNVNRTEVTTANNNFYRVLFGADNNTAGSSPVYVVTNANRLFYNPSTDTLSVGTLSGNATSATALSSARTFALTGDITGTVNSDLTSGASITTAIAAGVIVNADVNAAAAIAGTKISPNFGSQAVVTTGTITGASLIPSSATVPTNGLFLPATNTVGISTASTERLRVDSSGRLLVGLAAAFNSHPLEVGTTSGSAIAIAQFSNNINPGLLTFSKSRGSLGVNTLVASGDDLGYIDFKGADGAAGLISGGAIFCEVDATPSTGVMPGRLIFSTTPAGSGAPVERLRITNSGSVLIGTTTNTNNSALVVNGTISETVNGVQHLVVSSADIGTAPNQIPLNGYLGSMAFQDSVAVSVGILAVTGAGTDSIPSTQITGTWFTGGSSTTTKPQLLIEPFGTTSTGWSASGTGLGINAVSGFAGRLLDAQVNGTSLLHITSSGRLSIPLGTAALPSIFPGSDTDTGIYSPGANRIGFSTSGVLASEVAADGTLVAYKDISLSDGASFTTTLQTVTATANRTISFPDASGTIALVAGASGQVTYNLGGAQSGDANFTWSSTTGLLLGRQLTVGSPAEASTPAISVTGAWFTGGSGSTTKPEVLIEPAGATSNSWSTSGTGLGINAASGFTGRLIDLQSNGTSVFNVDATGRLSIPLGTAALPSIYPGTDTNTGLYSPGGDQVALTTAGTQKFTIGSLDGNPTIENNFPTIRPTLDLAFAQTKSLDPRIAFTRASEGTYTDSQGVLRTASIDEPRFGHNPLTGECLGLLVEEQRQNLLLRSEEFDNASWVKATATVTQNATIAPDGQTTADLLIPSNLAANGALNQDLVKAASPVQYTLSCYGKAKEHSAFRLILRDPANSGNRADLIVDLTTGVTSGSFIGGTYTGLSSSVQFLRDGWVRFSITATTGSETGLRAQVVNNTTGDGTSGLFIWGAQLEAGAFPTSYIPTTGTAATRTADVASISGTNFSSWYRQDEGTVFADVASIKSGGRVFMFDDSTLNNRWELRGLSGIPTLSSWSGGVQVVGVGSGASLGDPSMTAYKAALTNQLNNAAIQVNSSAIGIDATCTMPVSQSRLFIGSFQGTSTFANGTIRRITYWPARLPNATLQALTQ